MATFSALVQGAVPTVRNVVATAFLGRTDLDLREISKKVKNAEYKPRRFAAVTVRFSDPKSTVLIFKTGKIVCTGAMTRNDAEKAAKKCAKTINNALNIKQNKCSVKDFTIQNMVANCAVGYKISLEKLHTSEHQRFAKYNPEIFPGLIYDMGDPKMSLMIFSSGKITFTGAKSEENIHLAWDRIRQVLLQFRL